MSEKIKKSPLALDPDEELVFRNARPAHRPKGANTFCLVSLPLLVRTFAGYRGKILMAKTFCERIGIKGEDVYINGDQNKIHKMAMEFRNSNPILQDDALAARLEFEDEDPLAND